MTIEESGLVGLHHVQLAHGRGLGGVREAAVDLGHASQAGAEEAQPHHADCHHR